jgi:chromosome segregation ATPase
MDAGDFRTALRENEKALRYPLPISTDRVLFQRGLIYSHVGNPERDDNAARAYFQKVIDQYPSGDLAAAAKILMVLNGRVLSDAEALKSAAVEMKSATEEIKSVKANIFRQEGLINEQKRSIQRCGEELEGRREDIGKLTSAKDRMELTLKEQRGIIEQYQRVLKDRQELIDKLNTQIEDLKGQIEDFKKIDMNIEKKKQDTKLQ